MTIATATQAPLTLLEGPQTFQVFTENQNSTGYAQIIHGTLQEHRATLEKLNEAGMGVYYTVNQTDLQGRKAANITRVRAYFTDIDGTPDPHEKLNKLLTITRSKLPPSAVVESRNGLHCYWYAADGESIDPREYASVNEHLIARFGGDIQSKDLARVLRVPGFMHRKEENNPFLVKRILEDNGLRYTAEDIKRAFPLPAEEKPKRTPTPRTAEGRREREYEENKEDYPWIWEQVVKGLADWSPVDGDKHRVLLLAFGVARKFEIPQYQAEDDLYPIVATWNTKDSTEQSIIKHAQWSYSDNAEPATVAGLRRAAAGIVIDLSRKNRRKS